MEKSLIVRITHATGPIALRMAGSRLIPLWAVVRHRGRKSGKLYETPIAIGPTSDGFVLPLPWGEGTDWCRNLRAAGGGVIHWRGANIEVDRPEIIDTAAALPAFNAVLRPIVGHIGIKKFLRVHRSLAA
ncbi:MAG TPA: nitroreductase family deazaflavin-dependent oxidoreductase [Candidatus Limnocylindria bacterium]